MEKSDNLKLPYIMPSQSQKHVTHNEAIRQLDALVHLSVVSQDLVQPPGTPATGERYIIAQGATGEWLEHDGKIASFSDGAWTILEPTKGWIAYVEDQHKVLVHREGSWQDFPSLGALQNLDKLGIGAVADENNRFALAANSSLFSHAGDSHRLFINKAESASSASLIFQSDWVGHAEFGLAGNNDFEVKVSDDGFGFKTALKVDRTTGQTEFPSGVISGARIDFSGRWYANSSGEWMSFSNSQGVGSGNFNTSAGTGSEPTPHFNKFGPFVRKGTRLNRLLASFRCDNAQLTSINVRLMFQYADWSGAWDDTTLRSDLVHAADGLPILNDRYSKIDESQLGFVCPEDGFVLMYLQPANVVSGTRYVYSSICIETLSI